MKERTYEKSQVQYVASSAPNPRSTTTSNSGSCNIRAARSSSNGRTGSPSLRTLIESGGLGNDLDDEREGGGVENVTLMVTGFRGADSGVGGDPAAARMRPQLL